MNHIELIPDLDMVRYAWSSIVQPGDVHEIRIPKPKDPVSGRRRFYGTQAGWFDDVEAVVNAVAGISGADCEAVYLTVNPTLPDLIARSANRLTKAAGATSDAEIVTLRYLYLDLDAKRPAGISATDDEKAEALRQRDALVAYLEDVHGWPKPFMVGDSGNGGSLLYRLKDVTDTGLLPRVLTALAVLFPALDVSTGNPARLMKLPGTVAAKGDEVPGRPWRTSHAAFAHDADTVTTAMLEDVAGPQEAVKVTRLPAAGVSDRAWTVEDLLSLNGIHASERPASYGRVWDLDQCLASTAHSDGACLIEMASGALVYRCQHNSCAGKDWRYLRDNGVITIPEAGRDTTQGGFVGGFVGVLSYEKTEEKPHVQADSGGFVSSVSSVVEDLPPFPTRVLPTPFRDLVESGSRALGVPPDFVAIPLMAVTGGVIGHRQRIRLKRGWEEFAASWYAVVADPGSAKTPAQNLARSPLDTLQSEAKAAYDAAKDRFQDELARWERSDKAGRGERPAEPRMDVVYTSDATLESLVSNLSRSPAIPIIRDEIVSWMRSHDAYRGGKGGDRQSYLSMWSNVPIRLDRKTQEPLYIERPVVAVVGGIQPDLIPELSSEASVRDGFPERFLGVWPVASPPQWTDDEVPESVVREVTDAIRMLRRALPAQRPVQLSPEAKREYVSWYNENGQIAAQAQGLMAGFCSKLPSQTARLALTLHCMKHPVDPDDFYISVETMRDAILLAEYFRSHAGRILGAIQASAPLPGAGMESRIKRMLELADGEWVPQREIQRGLGGKTPVAQIVECLEKLRIADEVDFQRLPVSPSGGRPSPQWRISKRQNRQNRQNPHLPDIQAKTEGTSVYDKTLTKPMTKPSYSIESIVQDVINWTEDGTITASGIRWESTSNSDILTLIPQWVKELASPVSDQALNAQRQLERIHDGVLAYQSSTEAA